MGKKIILNEATFKRLIKKVLNEDIYEDQWEDEIKMFFDGLRNGNASVDNDTIFVEYEQGDDDGYDERYPRYIYYKNGENCLNDDDFCVQHSRPLTDGEMAELRNLASEYGMEVDVPEEYLYDGYEEDGHDY